MILSYIEVKKSESIFKYRLKPDSRLLADYVQLSLHALFVECPPLLPQQRCHFLPQKILFQDKYEFTTATLGTEFNIIPKQTNGCQVYFTCIKSLDERYEDEDIFFVQSVKAEKNLFDQLISFLCARSCSYIMSEDGTRLAFLGRKLS